VCGPKERNPGKLHQSLDRPVATRTGTGAGPGGNTATVELVWREIVAKNSDSRDRPRLKRGFSLLELLVVIVIISILASIAYPSYQFSVKRSRRALAQADLMAFANAMERRFSLMNTYLGAAEGGTSTGSPDPTVFQPTSPTTGGEVFYDLTIQAATQLTFTLQAAPVGSQANDGILTLNEAGFRTWNGQSGWD
jgi:type IV pilus assembly protein PilE